MDTHVCVHLTTAIQIHLVLLICIYSWFNNLSEDLPLGGTGSSLSSHYCLQVFTYTGYQLVLSFPRSYLGCILLRFPGHTQKTLSFSKPNSVAYTIFLLLLCRCFLSLRYRGCVVDVSDRAGHPTFDCSLCFKKVMAFCDALCMLQKKACLMESSYSYLWL